MLIDKEKINLDEVMVEVKLLLKGVNKKEVVINCLALDAIEFVDLLNNNRFVVQNAVERKKFENAFYFFDDYKRKETVCVDLREVKLFTIPFFMDMGKEYDLKIMMMK
ncbi:MAG: hypothetical protein APF81_17735 [Desulfosporosinus sp. BRH_c37]|nr:MAG: hypothetical protein APF81_17735 [Desulfosporosinus sp. BRH_c37]